MTGMEHAIERAEMVERLALRLWDDGLVRPEYVAVEVVETLLRCLAEDGLLAPATLREEWAVEGTLDSGDDWIADCEFATRLGAEDFLNRNEWARRDGGHVSRRYFTDWLPADRAEGDGRAEQ